MKRTVLLGVLIALAACSTDLQVLSPHERVASTDATAGDAEVGDASVPIGETGEPTRDGSVSPRDAGGLRDAGGRADAAIEPPADKAVDASTPRPSARVLSAFAQTCMVLDGALSCWGDDTQGAVGVLGSAVQPRPLKIANEPYLDVCAGEQHSCALRVDGTLSCWGTNKFGELGVGDFQPREQPTELTTRRFHSIACGGHNSCAIAQRGELYCWGENWEGKLGQDDPPREAPGTKPDMAVPVRVDPDRLYSHVSVGQGHVCAISEGSLYCWGRNDKGQLGVRETDAQFRKPMQVAAGTLFARVAAGQDHTCAIDGEGKLLCWGENTDGLLGLQTEVAIVRTPAAVGDDSDHVEVTANWFHTCALKKGGTLECWGRNEEGQLGQGDSMLRTVPTRVGPEFRWKSFAVGQFHTCAFDADGPWCWGANLEGQLGTGDLARKYLPTQVAPP